MVLRLQSLRRTFHHNVYELTRYKLSQDSLGWKRSESGAHGKSALVRTKKVSVVGQITVNNMKATIYPD